MSARRFGLAGAPAGRAIGAACCFAAPAIILVLLGLAAFPDGPDLTIGLLLGGFGAGGGGALIGAARLSLPAGSAWRQLGAELRAAAGLFLAFGALGGGALFAAIRFMPGSVWGRELGDAPFKGVVAGGALLAIHALTFLAARVALRCAIWWNRLRRRSLLWSLTNDQILGVLAVLLIGGACGAAGVLGSAVAAPHAAGGDGPAEAVARQLFNLAVLGPFYAAVIAVILLGALPLAALLATLLVRRIARRIAALDEATASFRRGEYATRVTVAGEDEIARLQQTFNAMAADLERTLGDLQAERDRVAGLLRARRELIASVSHELRTPVATLRGYLDAALAGDAATPAHLQADLLVMERETIRLQGLIDDLFTLSGAEVGRMTLQRQPVDLGAAIRRIVATVAPLAWRGGRVEVAAQVAPDLPPALLDAGRFEQIVRNLLHNAIRHTPPGGIVVAAAEAEGAAVLLHVRDTGDGIDPVDLPRIWERFYRAGHGAARAADGAGIGLALVKELTELMGGSVAVASTPGAGSAFTIRLPRAAPDDGSLARLTPRNSLPA